MQMQNINTGLAIFTMDKRKIERVDLQIQSFATMPNT